MISIYCCGCGKEVTAYLCKGDVIYPRFYHLHNLNFYRCLMCGLYVGTHHKGRSTEPLGVIATPQIKRFRQLIHSLIDPMWQNAGNRRQQQKQRTRIYQKLSNKLGYEYHTAGIKSVDEALLCLRYAHEIKGVLQAQ